MGLLSCVAFESLAAQTEQNEGVGVEIHPQHTDRVAIDFFSRLAVARATAGRACHPRMRGAGAVRRRGDAAGGDGGGGVRPARDVRLARGQCAEGAAGGLGGGVGSRWRRRRRNRARSRHHRCQGDSRALGGVGRGGWVDRVGPLLGPSLSLHDLACLVINLRV